MLRIDREKVLGKGGFGVVYEGYWNGITVAIKRIPLENAASISTQEEDALKTLNHDNIIKLFDVQEDLDFRYFVLELCNASLDQLFLNENDPKKYRGPMPPEEEVLLQLAKGLEHIHGNKLVHRDIKPENVLIWENPEKGKILMKWADFGLSKPVNERGTFSMTGVNGTTDWLAPEILKLMDEVPKNEEKKRGTVLSDVFAEGLVFGCFLRGGVHPFGTSSFDISVNLRTKKPTNLPENEEYKSIILKMLEKEPENRITSSAVVKLLTKIKMLKLFARSSLDDIEKLIQEGLDVNWKDNDGRNALLILCRHYEKENLIDIIRLLIEKGIEINWKNKHGWNALLILCRHYEKENLIDIIRLLIENGMEINCKDNGGSNALFILCQYYEKENLIDIIRLLIEKGIEINWKNKHGWNALLILCQLYRKENLIDIIRLLIENGMEINCKDNGGSNTLLHLCQNYEKENLIDIIRLLIENGIEINWKNTNGWNALLILCQLYRKENLIDIIRLLIEKGIEINWKDRFRWNALLILCENYEEENLIDIIRLLIENGIEINCENRYKRNALLTLCQNYKNKNLIDIIRLLIENGIEETYRTFRFIKEDYEGKYQKEILQLLR